jgi:hypothetical protein
MEAARVNSIAGFHRRRIAMRGMVFMENFSSSSHCLLQFRQKKRAERSCPVGRATLTANEHN